jgi:uncharacterized protein (TIGR02231 family)
MKNIIIAFITIVCLSSIQVLADEGKPINSTIEKATVYLQGASVHRTGNTALNPGITVLKFIGLTPYLDKNTLQVKGKGNFTILSITHRINYLHEAPKPKTITDLEDSLESLHWQLEFEKGLQKIYQSEEEMIMANKSIGNKDVGVDALDLKEVADLFRKRLSELNGLQLKSKQAVKDMQEKRTKIQQQLNGHHAKRNLSTSEVSVRVQAKERTPAKFELSYYVANAGWVPSYDIRAENTTDPIKLVYNAKVYQTTGVAWTNIRITLSTANPSRGGSKPVLRPWKLRLLDKAYALQQNNRANYGSRSGAPAAVMADAYKVMPGKTKLMEKANTAAAYTDIQENAVSTEFSIDLPYSIPEDGKQHDVSIQDFLLPAIFEHYSVPKLDKDPFLLARITGWEKLNLLRGTANLYFEGGYVGKSMIDPRITADTLDLSLGRDKGIQVFREMVKEFTSSKLIGNNYKKSFGFDIRLRNTKNETVTILVEDQVPLSTLKEIEVKAEELSGGSYNSESGKVSWKLTLEPSETRKVRLIYTVKQPKEKIISNL